MDPRGKVQVLTSPQALPPNCVVCNRHADGLTEFVDIGFQIEFYGAVYFCVDCLTPVAEACGYVPYKEFKDISNILEGTLDRSKELERDRDKFKSLLDDMLAYRPTVYGDSNASSTHDPSQLEITYSDSPKPELGTDESATESRSEDVPEPTKSNGSSSKRSKFDL